MVRARPVKQCPMRKVALYNRAVHRETESETLELTQATLEKLEGWLYQEPVKLPSSAAAWPVWPTL
jgi:hypothetical protein